MKYFIPFFIFLGLILFTICADKEQWRKRTIYHLLTDRFTRIDGQQVDCANLNDYCGGGYRGITYHLDYIKLLGFDAIMISPIIENYISGYHGYWSKNIFKLNDEFGSQKHLTDFITACHQNNILVMVDVVINNMGNTNTAYKNNTPFDDPSHYHDWCQISQQDFVTHNQKLIQNCRYNKLADLKQENEQVRQIFLSWIEDFVTKYKIDGLRIDKISLVPKQFLRQFSKKAGVFTIGEINDSNMSYIAGYADQIDSFLNYPFFYQMRSILLNKSMTNIKEYYTQWGRVIDLNQLNYMGNFCDNHDHPRILSLNHNWYDLLKIHKICHALSMTSVGIPIIYYGAQQNFKGGQVPANRQILWPHMGRSQIYQFFRTINIARKKFEIWNQPQVDRYVDGQFYSFSRGKFLVCLTNKLSGTINKTISYHPFSQDDLICNIFSAGDCINVYGALKIFLTNGQIKIYTKL